MGGTEVYVAALAHILQERGMEVVIAAPGEASREYVHEGIRIRRFAVRQQVTDLRELYGEGDELAANEFAKILEEEQPDIVHLHAFTSAVSLRLVRAAKMRNLPVIFTYHTPTVSCQRGTMMRWGKEPCDGLMDVQSCSACTLDGLLGRRERRTESGGQRAKGKSMVAKLAGFLPPGFGALLGKTGLQGGIWTALRMTELVKLRHTTTRALFVEVDHIVAVCDWVKQVLLRNGVPQEKITLCRQGIALNAEPLKPEALEFKSGKQKAEMVKEEIGGQSIDVERQRPEDGIQRSEVRGQRVADGPRDVPARSGWRSGRGLANLWGRFVLFGALRPRDRSRSDVVVRSPSSCSPSSCSPSSCSPVVRGPAVRSPLRIVFLGRLDPTKGIHILIQAIRSLPASSLVAPKQNEGGSDLRLDIYGVAQGGTGKSYGQTLRRMAQGDERINFCPPVPANEIIGVLKKHDILAVPSQWLETGPLVVLEAFAAGIPVIGSRLGGIAELVQDGVNGILVEAEFIEAWAAALARLSNEPALLAKLRSGIILPTTTCMVADKMIEIYKNVTRQTAFTL